MNFGVLSLIVFVAIVAISYFTNINCGLLGMAAAIIIGRLAGLTNMEIVAGVNLNVFISMLGMFIYSAVLMVSGTLELFTRKFLNMFRVGPKLWPLICFLFTCAFCSAGPVSLGATLVPIVTISVGVKIGCKPLPVGLITVLGSIAGFCSPITGESGVPAYAIAVENGFEGNVQLALWAGCFFCALACAIFIYVVCGCWRWKLPEGMANRPKEELPAFSKNQWICLASLPVFIVLFVITGWQVGLLVCIFSSLLIGLKIVDQKEVLSKTAWGVLLLVVGTGLFMNVCKLLGGVDILATAIQSISNATTVTPIYFFTGGFLSWFSYALAVPIPSLAPTIAPVLGSFGLGTAAQLATYSALVAGSFIATISPLSMSGAAVMGIWATLENPDEATRSKFFTKQLLLAIATSIFGALFTLTGIIQLFT